MGQPGIAEARADRAALNVVLSGLTGIRVYASGPEKHADADSKDRQRRADRVLVLVLVHLYLLPECVLVFTHLRAGERSPEVTPVLIAG